eukprot:1175970-Prorocentrum_minimum.AAC.1
MWRGGVAEAKAVVQGRLHKLSSPAILVALVWEQFSNKYLSVPGQLLLDLSESFVATLPVTLDQFCKLQRKRGSDMVHKLWTKWMPAVADGVRAEQRAVAVAGSVGSDADRGAASPRGGGGHLTHGEYRALDIEAAVQMRVLVLESMRLCSEFFKGYMVDPEMPPDPHAKEQVGGRL